MKLSEAQFRRTILDMDYISDFNLTIVKKILDWTENSWYRDRIRLVVMDDKNGDMEVDSNEFMKACSKSLSEGRNPVLWLPGKYWSDEPWTMVLEILDKEVKNTEEKKLTLWPFKE